MPPGSRLPLVIVLLAVLGLLVAAPAAGAPAAGTTGEGPLDGTLDSDSSDTDSESDSTDTNLTDSESSLSSSSPDSTSSDSTSGDSSSTSGSDSTGSSGDSSGSSTSDGSSAGTDGSSGESIDDLEDLYTIDLDDGLDAIEGSAGELSVGSLEVAGEGSVGAVALKLSDVRTLDRVSRLEVENTAGTADALDAGETITDLTGLAALSTVNLYGTDDPGAVGQPADASGRETDLAPATSNLQPAGEGTDGSIPAPGPTGGVALGVGAVAAAGIARQWGSTPALLSGLGATVASVAPATTRWGPLDRLVRTIAPFRYSRYDDSDPLEHDARENVFELVQQSPGAYLSEVSDGADLPLSTARHHVRVLEQEDLVTGAKVRGKRRFYPAYTDGIELTAAMNDESTAAILDAIARLGAASVSDLAGELERDPSTVSHHLQRLESDDLIVRERDGRAVLNRLSADARTVLEPDREPVEAASESLTAGGAD